jgi:hypothetical protein
MKFGSLSRHFGYSILSALLFAGAVSSEILAQDGHSHGAALNRQDQTGKQKEQLNALVKVVREATERYKDVRVAENDDFQLQFGCVSGPDAGAMGLHYVNMARVLDGELDAARPEIVIYEPQPNGRPKLIGADYLVLAAAWDAKNQGPPQLGGQLFHLFESPNRFGLPAFYTLHVWAWKDNPTGTFTNWHPNVSCNAFGGGQQ